MTPEDHLDGRLDAAATAAYDAMLRRDAQARRDLLIAAALTAAIGPQLALASPVRPMRRWPLLAAAAALAIGLATAGWLLGPSAAPALVIAAAGEGVEVVAAEGVRAARSGQRIPAGAVVRTRGAAASITLADGSELRLGPGSELYATRTGGRIEPHLAIGSLVAAYRPQSVERGLTTPHLAIAVVGTRFTVEVGAATMVAVEEGRVRCTVPGRAPVEVAAGGRVGSADGPHPDALLRLVPFDDAEGDERWESRNPDRITVARSADEPASGAACWRIAYIRQPGGMSWGQVGRPLAPPPGFTGLRCRLRTDAAAPGALWNVLLVERDGETWWIGGGRLDGLGPGWQAVDMVVPRQPKRLAGNGDGRFDPATAESLVFSLVDATATVSLDDLVLVARAE